MLRALLLCGTIGACTQQALAHDNIDHCPLPNTVRSTTRLQDLPPWIAGWTRGMGRRDGPLATDALRLNNNPPFTRLFRAFARKGRWVVVREQGGFAQTAQASLYYISRDNRFTRHLSDDVPIRCAAIVAALQPQPDDS